MKFVFFGYDFSLNVARRLIKDGHDLCGAFTFPCDNIFNFNKDLIALAKSHNAPLSLEKPTAENIQMFIEQGCDLFLSCGYSFKIPPIDESRAYGINTHPSALPKGRGLMPTPHIIMHAPEAAGFTVHKLTPDFDAGDILYQEKIKLTNEDTVDSYAAEIAKRTPQILSKIIADLPTYWKNAQPQNEEEASAFAPPNEATRTINWNSAIQDIDRKLRAFGSFGCFAHINGKPYAIFAHSFSEESHDFDPGTMVEATDNAIKIAAKGGFITATKFQMI